MARRILWSLVSVTLLCVATFADEPAPSNDAVPKAKPGVLGVRPQVQAQPNVKVVPRTQVLKNVPAQAEATEPKVVFDKNSAAGQLESLSKASKSQLDATIEFAKAKTAADEAGKAVEKLKQDQAANPDAVTDAQKKELAQAEQALEAALAEVKAKQEKTQLAVKAAEAAAAQTVIIRQNGVQGLQVVAVRAEVDPEKDDTERFILLLPGGPFVVEATMLIDGKSFQIGREELITQMIKSADMDADGKTTWAEAFASPRFSMNRIRLTTPQQVATYTTMLDSNMDLLVDRFEARQYLATYFNGAAFSLAGTGNNYGGFGGSAGGVVLNNGQYVGSGNGQGDVKSLFGTDSDGTLSEAEIAVAGERLKSRDADDNDLLYSNEVVGAGAVANRGAFQPQGGNAFRQAPLQFLLGPTVSASQINSVLVQTYKNSEGEVVAASFSAVPELFKELDKNEDGKLSESESGELNSAKPRMVVRVELGKTGGGKLLVNGVEAKDNSTSVELPGVKISVTAITTAVQGFDYSQTANAYLTRYDNDKNGYLDKDELAGNFAQQLTMWDLDGDGKVFPKEITESYTMALAPSQTQIQASVASQGNPLFQTLDLSGDGRLSLREMRTAHQQILKFDENNDGQITVNEIPQAFAISFGRGAGGFRYPQQVAVGRGGAQPNQPAANPNAPAWFTRMDRNGDGDITLKEFLGEKVDFEKLDTNKDGFIEPAEAKAAAE